MKKAREASPKQNFWADLARPFHYSPLPMQRDTITVERVYTEQFRNLELKLVAGATGLKRIIREPTVNRPGLALAGFTRYFASKRLQVFGNAECWFLKTMSAEERKSRYANLFSFKIPGVIFSRNLDPDKLFLRAAEQAQVPIFVTPMITMKFINLATLALEMLFAPRGTEIGSMVDILGVGVILRGESGIGKSESVLALIERGYSLVSDDITRVTLIDGREIVGTSAEVTRNHMEVRGIGIINVADMFGVRSIRTEKVVDLVITLKQWEDVPDVDRLGMEQETVKILGVEVPHITIPVRPGRDLARLIEVAAFHIKLKSSGRNPAKELNDRLIAQMAGKIQI
jgi:HPr kinase/phosphorylase